MRRLIAIAIVLASLWGGYWLIASNGLRKAIDLRSAELRAAGWDLQLQEHQVRGFPSRIDTRVRGLRLSPPDGSLVWQAPSFEVLALSYRPNHVIAVWPEQQTLDLGAGPLTIKSADLRASLRLQASTDLPLQQLTLVGEQLQLSGPGIEEASAEGLQLALRPATARANLYEAALQVQNGQPPLPVQALLGWRGDQSPKLDKLLLNAELGFDKPLDRHAPFSGGPVLQQATLTGAHVQIGETRINMNGALGPGPDGVLQGKISLNAKGWQALLRQIDLPDLDEEVMIELLSGLAQPDGTLQLDLEFRDGFIHFGLIPLLPAPRLP